MRCAVYIRVSTDKEEQKTSLITQQQLFDKYIKDNGWTLYDTYIDIESGTKSKKRANLKRLMDDCSSKKYDVILSKELSRLARNGELSYQLRNSILSNGINIITLDGAINTLTNNTDNFGLFAWLYEQESQRISTRMKSAFKIRAQNGKYKGSFAPYGYYVEDKRLYIKKDTTPEIVKRIFNDYLSGKGFDRIAKELYEEDIPSPGQVAGKSDASNQWNGSSVRNILTNANYTGDLVQGKSETVSVTSDKRKDKNENEYIVIKNCHEAIITKTVFDTVQNIISSRKKIRPQQNIHLFTNILFCNDCGHGMNFKKNRKGYVCGRFNKLGRKACSDHLIKEAELADAILDDIRLMLSKIKSEKFLAGLEKKVLDEKMKVVRELKIQDKELNNLMQQKINATRKFIMEQISEENYNAVIFELDNEISNLTAISDKYKILIDEKYNTNLIDELYSLKDTIFELNELTPDILHRFVERIEIKSDGTPKIFYRFSESSIYFSIFFNNTQHSTWLECSLLMSWLRGTYQPFLSVFEVLGNISMVLRF
jgi:DNA invertase Pin-like site-specific DNA recombinase